jgi:hypothetical protein
MQPRVVRPYEVLVRWKWTDAVFLLSTGFPIVVLWYNIALYTLLGRITLQQLSSTCFLKLHSRTARMQALQLI